MLDRPHLCRARNPIPRIDFGAGGASDESGSCRGQGRGPNCVNFKPPCDDSWLKVHPKDGAAQAPGDADDEEGECSGDWTSGTIVDKVLIPKDLKPGDYVVGWCVSPPTRSSPSGMQLTSVVAAAGGGIVKRLRRSGAHARIFVSCDFDGNGSRRFEFHGDVV